MEQPRLDLPLAADIAIDFQPSERLLITIEHRTRVAFQNLSLRLGQLQFIPRGLAVAKPLPPSRCLTIGMGKLGSYLCHNLLQIP